MNNVWRKSDKHQIFALLWAVFGYTVSNGFLALGAAAFTIVHAGLYMYHGLKENRK